ncbi:lipase family alpha/beta hydrolase [Thioalkalivibrio paradoxus]|uniref:Oxygen sensor protein n=1 Tax=Thioalkalivibrio paradoxus ARh 1 TaxID=713585 RepID=W0DM95_9GAMM|nr:alpha/beta fold hydrolase [Thioalkalivibrio paradoxus]AHE99581.1 oxygen sensor protein [Thioalkalivibrio paradoxus ARh 1]
MKITTTRRLVGTALLLLLLWSPALPASVMVLVHGYLGDGESFHRAGVIDALQTAGWQYAGDWRPSANGRPELVRKDTAAPNTVYTVTLPATAPLVVQADWLSAMRREIAQRHPGEPVTLVGHSAGGVVARLSLVRSGEGAVEHLITIASPHLGTGRAIQALEATQGGGLLGPFRQILTRQAVGGSNYDALRHSRAVLVDLTPPAQGNLLGWLNAQEHPDITYDAVVRNTGFRMGGDLLVPAYSQDLNQIPALRGRATVTTSPLEHGLEPQDARLILERIAARTGPSA